MKNFKTIWLCVITACALLVAGTQAQAPKSKRINRAIELLEAGLDDVAPPLSDAWRRVIAARLADFDAGRVEAVPWAEVRARMEERRSTRG